MTHRRPKQIKKLERMMEGNMVLFGFGIKRPDGTIKFVEAKDLAEWQEKYVDRIKVFGTDWNKEIIVL